MSYTDNLITLDTKKGTFSILLTLTIICIFVICTFYSYITPKINETVNTQIDKITIDATTRINNILFDYQSNNKIFDVIVPEISKRVFSDEISGILKTLSDREKTLANKINTYIKVFTLTIIIIMCATLYFVNKSIVADGGDISYPVFISAITLLILGVFQIFFYKYAKSYKYIGSLGNEEIINMALNNISF